MREKRSLEPLFSVLSHLKGIVSRDFRCLQMILMDRIEVPDVPLKGYFFLNFLFHIVYQVFIFQQAKLLLTHLAKA